MRESRDRQRARPSVSQTRIAGGPRGDWRTLREAMETTGIPIGTLRKWCRRGNVESYLESDGELTLRMVEMSSVRARAASLDRDAGANPAVPDETAARYQLETPGPASAVESPTRSAHESSPLPEPATMIVPVDAWNKMLNQLGNLHEAGQQLAEARERAAKAETEAKFLRERLVEMRKSSAYESPATSFEHPVVPPIEKPADAEERSDDAGGLPTPLGEQGIAEPVPESTPFWRYVVRGWRDRRT